MNYSAKWFVSHPFLFGLLLIVFLLCQLAWA